MTVDNMVEVKVSKKQSMLAETWRRYRKSKVALLGLLVLFLLIIIAVFAPLIAPLGFDHQNISEALTGPGQNGHIFGTDNLGRDIFDRLVWGTRITLKVGLIAVAISAGGGCILGAVAGYFGGWKDNIIMRAMDILLAIPGMLLAIAIAATLGSGMTNAIISVGIAGIPGFARIVRSSVLSVRGIEYIEAAHAINASDMRIILRHIVPNVLAPILVQATLSVASAIMQTASLSFLGLGIQPPDPEWGAMISGARSYLRDYGYLVLFPGLAIMTAVFSVNVIGDGLRDALDPRLKQ